jgi:hypothetical protein
MSASTTVDLPAPGVAGDADDVGAAGELVQLPQHRERRRPPIVDVAHQARARANVAGADRGDQLGAHGEVALKRCSGPPGV